MSLIIATGSNIGNKIEHLEKAKNELKKFYTFKAQSQVFSSDAVDYTDQPGFYNQVLEFDIPDQSPIEVLNNLLDIEKQFGRVRDIDKGPRTIDIDIIFWK
jgi:2-amino-4-hydroxy-6-hydroxymethyldihydropteridine diphosphokinase